MKEVGKKGELFYSKWEVQRRKKWQYVFRYGVVYWGLTVAIVSFLLNSHFKIENMQIPRLISSIIAFGIGGIGFGLWQFKRMDSIYLGLNDTDKIKTGIKDIETGQTWNYENLKVSQDNEGRLVIQNELFWYEKANLSTTELNECFNLVMDDFRRLQKNPDFEEFSKSKEITIQIFDNSENEIPLIEKKLNNTL